MFYHTSYYKFVCVLSFFYTRVMTGSCGLLTSNRPITTSFPEPSVLSFPLCASENNFMSPNSFITVLIPLLKSCMSSSGIKRGIMPRFKSTELPTRSDEVTQRIGQFGRYFAKALTIPPL